MLRSNAIPHCDHTLPPGSRFYQLYMRILDTNFSFPGSTVYEVSFCFCFKDVLFIFLCTPPPIVAPSYPPETWISQSWIYPTRGYLKKISFLGQMVYENIFQKFFYFFLFLNNCVWKRWSLIFTLLKPPWLTILSTKFSYHWFCFRVEEICFFFFFDLFVKYSTSSEQ